MKKRRLLKHRITAICICAAVLCTALFAGDMEVNAKSDASNFKVDVAASSSVKAGKKATFKITITNTTSKSQKVTKLQTVYEAGEGADMGEPSTRQFGTLKDSKGRKLERNKDGGKLKKSIKFAAKEKKVYTLSGKMPKDWGSSPVFGAMWVSVNDYGYRHCVNYASYYASKGVKISSVKSAAKKKATVKWKKAEMYTDGYQIQYSLNKNFKNAKTKTVNNKKTSLTLKNLKSKRVYYVRIRTCIKQEIGSAYYTWSSVKKVKVK